MIIKKSRGYELEKEKSNTSEDFFNRSELTFIESGNERTLHVLYVRYFDEQLSEFTPFSEEPLFKAGKTDISLKDIVALVCLIKNPALKNRKRLYVHDMKEFASYFNDVDFSKLPDVYQSLENQGSYDLNSPLELILQHT